MRERPLFSKDSTLVNSNRYWDLVKQRAEALSLDCGEIHEDYDEIYQSHYKNCRRGDTIDVQKSVILYHHNELLNYTNAMHDAEIPTDQGSILADFDVDPSAITEARSDELTPGVVIHVTLERGDIAFDNNLVGVTEPKSKFMSDVLQQCDDEYDSCKKKDDIKRLLSDERGVKCFEKFKGLTS
ncbi:hypothetical protein RLOatenuis_3570 [Rickettsiales bacterium]|nr:hypothetical protein RLOatenuis_3570 [Rickettsiales bacterium]